jgi:hypothetical protein
VAARTLDAEIDRLYQGPLGEFTAARNALARRAGADAVRALVKPSLPAWAVNQLYWRHRDAYKELVRSAERLRAAHQAAASGRRADPRDADAAHDRAAADALKQTLAILREAGHPVTAATQQAISQTLQALPAGDRPGRLTAPLRPGGFEILAGVTPRLTLVPKPAEPQRPAASAEPAAPPSASARAAQKKAQKQRIEAAAEAARAAKRTLEQARRDARQREADLAAAARRLDARREEEEHARERLAEAERAAEQARFDHERQERAAEQAHEAMREADRAAREAEAALAEVRGRGA